MSSNSIINKYKNMPKSVKASMAFAICNIIQKGISVITVPIFTRLLSTEEYGNFTIYSSWLGIIQIFATLNLFYGVYNNGLIKYKNEQGKLTSSMLGLSSTVSIIVFIVFLLFHSFWTSFITLSFKLITLIFIQLFFESAFMFWSAQQRFNYKYKTLVIITLLMTFSNVTIGLIAVLLSSNKAEARIYSSAFVYIVIGLFFYFIIFKKSKVFFDKKIWKFALRFNIPLIPHYLSGVVLNQADRIMINNMIGKSEAAIYGVAYTFAFLVNIISNAINSSFLPYTYQKMEGRDYVSIRKSSLSITIVVAIPIILLMAFGPEVIKIFAASEYYRAIWVIPPVAVSVLFTFIYSLFVNIEFYYETNKFIMIGSSIAAVMNILLNLIFINIFGFIAAGYTTLACYIVYMVAHYFFYRIVIKQNSINEIYNVRYLFLISIVAIAFMLLMLISYKIIILRYSIILILLFIMYINRKKIITLLKSIKTKKKGSVACYEDNSNSTDEAK